MIKYDRLWETTHHVFYPDYITGYGINTILGDVKLVNRIMLYLKICIAGFAFLTAFGLTRIFKGQKDGSNKNFFRIVVKRLAKLELIVIIVYLHRHDDVTKCAVYICID